MASEPTLSSSFSRASEPEFTESHIMPNAVRISPSCDKDVPLSSTTRARIPRNFLSSNGSKELLSPRENDKTKWKVAPAPNALSISIFPPNKPTRCDAIDSPKPTPP